MTTFLQRLINAAWLDPDTYEEIKNDPSVNRQLAVFLVLAGTISVITDPETTELVDYLIAPVIGFIGSALVWVVHTWPAFFVGRRLFPPPGPAITYLQFYRTTFFSLAPFCLLVLPALGGWLFGFIGELWMLLGIGIYFWHLTAFVLSIRVALGYPNHGTAVAVFLVSDLIVYGLILAIVLLIGFNII